MENKNYSFVGKKFTTLVKTREIVNCVTGEKSKFPNEYFVYDNEKECEIVIPDFHPTSYDDIRNKAIELNEQTQ